MRTLTHFFAKPTANSSCVYISSLSCRAAAAAARRELCMMLKKFLYCVVYFHNGTKHKTERDTAESWSRKAVVVGWTFHSVRFFLFRCECADRIYDDDDEGSPRDTIHAKIYIECARDHSGNWLELEFSTKEQAQLFCCLIEIMNKSDAFLVSIVVEARGLAWRWRIYIWSLKRQ